MRSFSDQDERLVSCSQISQADSQSELNPESNDKQSERRNILQPSKQCSQCRRVFIGRNDEWLIQHEIQCSDQMNIKCQDQWSLGFEEFSKMWEDYNDDSLQNNQLMRMQQANQCQSDSFEQFSMNEKLQRISQESEAIHNKHFQNLFQVPKIENKSQVDPSELKQKRLDLQKERYDKLKENQNDRETIQSFKEYQQNKIPEKSEFEDSYESFGDILCMKGELKNHFNKEKWKYQNQQAKQFNYKYAGNYKKNQYNNYDKNQHEEFSKPKKWKYYYKKPDFGEFCHSMEPKNKWYKRGYYKNNGYQQVKEKPLKITKKFDYSYEHVHYEEKHY
eukprot:403372484